MMAYYMNLHWKQFSETGVSSTARQTFMIYIFSIILIEKALDQILDRIFKLPRDEI